MPFYTFQCGECGYRFEESVPFADREKPMACQGCKAVADRLLPTSVAGLHKAKISGPTPQNTGLTAYDAHVDRVIGQSAEQGWTAQERRVADKREFLRQHPEATGHDLTQNPDGSWGVLSKEERGFQDRALTINSKAIQTLRPRK